MNRVLVLGATGMLGHKVCQLLPGYGHEVVGTTRRAVADLERFGAVFDRTSLRDGVDANDDAALKRVVNDVRPGVIVNCIGIVKQCRDASDALLSARLNSHLPHELALLAAEHGARLIHFSTDCVFTGTRGGYTEQDQSDAEDLYGTSKYLGETAREETAAITLRTSIIGRELKRPPHGLLEWFLSRRGAGCRGFTGAVYTGLTTVEMARIIDLVIRAPQLHGLYHVASVPINKYDLLCLVARVMQLTITVEQDVQFMCNRSLIMDGFHRETGYVAPAWEAMIDALRADPTPYDEWFGTA